MWKFYPSATEPPAWLPPVIGAFAAARPHIDSRLNVGVSSDAALAALRPGRVRQGFGFEKGSGRKAVSERRRME
jgi:DNA-binding transcriptional LysR family regulator